ncbi:hypothetical protein KP509_37G000400 [Ceratopteris richardii]|uniref:Endonuclease/exonuclease/phosphatase domain-containing protein n=1 Tax=Ceratopteris richardii TaxID=49495 RepID=A0A8T2Q5H0_CERRI|nr:hypothetical protein KP509_37G000400 [Ceratopteris richardii]
MSELHIISINVKGLTDPVRPKMINKWLSSLHKLPDVLCLQEVKVGGSLLKINLNLLSPRYKWYSTNHPGGKGGAVIGLVLPLSHLIDDFSISSSNQWCGLKLGKPFDLSIVSIYAANSSLSRKVCWEELSLLPGPLILMGDFNMVTSLNDRWECKGSTIRGSEKAVWIDMCNGQDIFDLSQITGFTWSNKQIGKAFTAARLDRCYANNKSIQNCWDVRVQADPTLLISDHRPLIVSFKFGSPTFKAGWPHIDTNLLKIPCVMSQTKRLFYTNFSTISSPSRAWIKSVKDIQFLFTHCKKQARAVRAKRRETLMNKLNSLDCTSQEFYDTNLRLSKECYLEASYSLASSKEFWSEKIDRNNKYMFSLLKKSKVRTSSP